MSLTPVPVNQFRGLNLVDDPEEVGAAAAISSLNVDGNKPGRIRSRDGLASFATPGAGTPTVLYPYSPTAMLVVRDDQLDRVTSSGVTTNVGTVMVTPSVATLGTPSARYTFFAVFNTTMRRYDGAALANSTGQPSFIAVHPVDNRLVQAYFANAGGSPTGADGSTSTVFFSDPGDPETYGANNFLHLHPGDGEDIVGMVTWRELLFVFKQTRAFVFYGTSTASDGSPIFNYRTIDLPSPHSGIRYATVAGVDGVYFVCQDGIYRTAGDQPVRMSNAITPIFDGTASSDLTVKTSGMTLSWVGTRLYCEYRANDDSYRWLVWDRPTESWLVWMVGSGADRFTRPTGWAVGRTTDVYTATDGQVLKLTDGQTTDDGTAIASHYQSGFYELGSGEAFTRWTRLRGSGSPTVGVLVDHGTSDSRAAAVTLGTSPAVAEGYHQQSYTGRLFSHRLSASSGAWSVSSLAHDVSLVRS